MKLFRILSVTLSVAFLALTDAMAQPAPYQAVYSVDGSKTAEDNRSRNSIEAFGKDQSAAIAYGGSKLSMTWMRIHKTAGTASKSEEYPGLNASVLALEGSRIGMDNCTVSSHSGYSDVASAVGSGSALTITNGSFQSTRQFSPVVTAYDGALCTNSSVKLASEDSHSPLACSHGDASEIRIENCKGYTGGIVSPLFRGSGRIMATGCHFQSKNSNYVTIEGSGNIEITECELLDAAEGAIKAINIDGVPSANPSRLNISKSKMVVKTGGLISAVNCNSEIVLEKNTISTPKGAAFLEAYSDEFGEAGKNGGHVKVRLVSQAVTGDVLVNEISSAVIELGKGSTLKGAVNPEGAAGRVDIYLAKGAVWSSKSGSNVTVVRFEQPVEKGVKQIKSKGDIVYDASDPLNAPLGGREFKLAGGGHLRPSK